MKLLATWELGLRYGHVAVLAALAEAFGVLGHRMSLAAKDVVTAAGPRGTGEPFAAVLQAPLLLRSTWRAPTRSYGQVIADGGFVDPGAAVSLVRAWLMLFEHQAPDLIVAEHAPMSLLAAHVAGIPAVRTGSAFMAPAPDPEARRFPELPGEAVGAHDAAAGRVVTEVVARLGGAPLDGLAGLLARAPAFLATWPELDHFRLQAGQRYYGPLRGIDAGARPAWPAGEGPRVFVYLPFAHRAAAAVIERLGALGWPALWHSQDRPAGDLPATITYSADPIDMAHALDSAAVLVGRAGHATCAAALRHGVPALLFPDTLEAAMLARQLLRAALAVVPLEPSAAAVGAGLEQLTTDARIGAACAAARSRYAGYRPDIAADRMARDMLATLPRS